VGIGLLVLALVVPAAGLVVDWVVALGEELGWRGLLVPALAERMGFTRASLASRMGGALRCPMLAQSRS
jgi:membrane protease YdiL (CAAX protease family)